MRNGMNPNRLAKVNGHPPIVAAAITHLPNMQGYHEKRLEVIQASLTTMRERAGVKCAVLVWDNGSCETFRYWLMNVYKPDYLILSANVGKASARASIVRMFDDDTVIGIADDDMYYYQGWLSACLKVLTTYPKVGQVSCYPVRTQQRWGNSHTLAWAQVNADLQVGRFIPEQWDKDFCTSIGRDYVKHLMMTTHDRDYLITYKNVQTYGVAHHCQFVGITGILKPFCRFDDDAMGDEKPFDNAVDAGGYLRLTTRERYCRHIGNVLDKELIA